MARSTQTLLLLGLSFALRVVSSADPVRYYVKLGETDNGQDVPPGFVGLSLEPVNSIKYMAGDKVFKQLLKNLVSYNTGPINIRWGGNSQDEDPAVIENEAWIAMAELYKDLNNMTTFTIPLDLRTGKDTDAKEQIDGALDILPAEAVYAINIGNEPDRYMWTNPKDFDNSYLKKGYWDDVVNIMETLEPQLEDWGVPTKIFSGPGVADPGKFTYKDVSKWAKLGQATSDDTSYTKLLTWHNYAASGTKENATIAMILQEHRAQALYDQVEGVVARCNKIGLQFRLDETNTVSHSGAYGVSNTMGAALWVIDHALSLMQAGAVGFNLHGAGCSPYSPVLFPGNCNKTTAAGAEPDKFQQMCRGTCGKEDAAAEVNAPYYGLLFLQKILRNHMNVTILPIEGLEATGSGEEVLNRQDRLKVYVLSSEVQLRVVMINKVEESQQVDIFVPNSEEDSDVQEWGFGTVIRLEANGKLDSHVNSINLAGQSIDPSTGMLTGTAKPCKIESTAFHNDVPPKSSAMYSVTLQPASATVLVIPTGQGLRKGFQELFKKGLDDDHKCAESAS